MVLVTDGTGESISISGPALRELLVCWLFDCMHNKSTEVAKYTSSETRRGTEDAWKEKGGSWFQFFCFFFGEKKEKTV